MCDVNCVLWVAKNITSKEISGKRVVEVGSYDVNGSVRPIIELLGPKEYIGIDLVPGPGVDIICRAEQLVEKFGLESVDVVISCTTLEHIKDWHAVVSNLKQICKPNGIMIIIVPSVWPFHAYPYDYWRFSGEDIRNIFGDCNILTLDEDNRKDFSLVYAKITKPSDFCEKDISGYPLYSIILKKRLSYLDNVTYNRFIRRYHVINLPYRLFRRFCSLLPWM
jgi:SAM-dependent methyltransferase